MIYLKPASVKRAFLFVTLIGLQETDWKPCPFGEQRPTYIEGFSWKPGQTVSGSEEPHTAGTRRQVGSWQTVHLEDWKRKGQYHTRLLGKGHPMPWLQPLRVLSFWQTSFKTVIKSFCSVIKSFCLLIFPFCRLISCFCLSISCFWQPISSFCWLITRFCFLISCFCQLIKGFCLLITHCCVTTFSSQILTTNY